MTDQVTTPLNSVQRAACPPVWGCAERVCCTFFKEYPRKFCIVLGTILSTMLLLRILPPPCLAYVLYRV